MAYSYSSIVDSVRRALENNPSATLGSVAIRLGIERHTITKAIRIANGMCFRKFKQFVVLSKAQDLLSAEEVRSIKEVSYSSGFNSPRSFHRSIVKAFGMSPSELRLSLHNPVPDLRSILHEAYLKDLRSLGSSVAHLQFQLNEKDGFCFDPGQYVSILTYVKGKLVTRAFFIASSPHSLGRDGFGLCVRMTEQESVCPLLSRLREGDRMRFLGPFGLFTLRWPLDPLLVFVCTGTAIAPIRSMLQYLETLESEIPRVERWLFYGARNEEDLLYRNEFEQRERTTSNFRFVPVVSKPTSDWRGCRGHVQDSLFRFLSGKRNLRLYACGRVEMIQDIQVVLKKINYPSSVLVADFNG